MSRLTDLLALSIVPRWAICDHTKPQSVADHTFRVLVIATEIANRMGSPLSLDAMVYILHHDADECRSGDIPTPAKLAGVMSPGQGVLCPWFTEIALSKEEMDTFIVADMIEAITFIGRYGVGAHAYRVYRRMMEDLKIKLTGMSQALSDIAHFLIAEIEDDRGR